MSYRIKDPHHIQKDIRRIARGEIDRALKALEDPEMDRHQAVHQARKCFKRFRALLRLVRETLGPSRYNRENIYFRDVGRKLSYIRDAEAMIETFDRLQQHFPQQMATPALQAVRTHLVERREALSNEANHLEETISALIADLKQARTRVKAWPIKLTGFKAINRGMSKMYCQGSVLLKQARKRPSDEHFHEWRKRAKGLRYHTTLLQAIWPDMMDGYIAGLDLLSDYLGEEHDITVFREMLTHESSHLGKDKELYKLRVLLLQEQDRLRGLALRLGHRVYAEKSRNYTRRTRTYWQAWENDTRHGRT